jgi:GNAT superfamily N-acetyltransferase
MIMLCFNSLFPGILKHSRQPPPGAKKEALIMVNFILVETNEHRQHVRSLYMEYLTYVNQRVSELFGFNFDVEEFVERDMNEIYKLSPPQGRLFLAQKQGQIAGLGGLRPIGESTGEIKRMFVRPDYQRNGIGHALLEKLIEEARLIGYKTLRLDVGPNADSARDLYASAGFSVTEPFVESEVPPVFYAYWQFMEMPLR